MCEIPGFVSIKVTKLNSILCPMAILSDCLLCYTAKNFYIFGEIAELDV
jgi:hypothetical protein